MDVLRRNQVPAAPGRSGLACHDLYGGAQGKVTAFLADGPPQEFLGVAPQAEEGKSGDEDSDKKSVDKEVSEPSKRVKRTVMHCVHYNALTIRSCFL